ncbi:hypothetical protein BGW36DRAFT_318480 [Talaromyces proteolyticus]|uniref:Zn(2)-C6 fungal-type domain-containing protein n=1 Tax=Talaromyces proteolyticus TaxID=1131652 RepID=A0AAD4KTB3_9EURO|nr:uncharacterized protein BGW36DRAFT_318480 [Talaromyces proteolyticus]KAH8698843.1 hypothetical protein BGW36DRAFT_318480 [Talaromyces proteolyticus]
MDNPYLDAHHDSDMPGARATQACLPCRHKKRRCDKALPSCTLCSRLKRSCAYPDGASSESVLFLRQRVQELEEQLGAALASQTPATSSASSSSISNIHSNNIDPALSSPGATPPQQLHNHHYQHNIAWVLPAPSPAAPFISQFFLDAEAFENARPAFPKPTILIPAEARLILGGVAGIQTLLDVFFSTIHVWFPFISKSRLCKQTADPASLPADTILLFLAMHLLCHNPRDDVHIGGVSLYATVKQLLVVVESNGLLTLNMMQAAILIALYEICHAMYPAAYLSTGHCARLGYSVGLHDRRAPRVFPKLTTWGGNEELRRAWYAVMILDRYVNIGSRKHPLASGDFDSNGSLPADDQAWDRGDVEATQPMFITSSTPIKVGGFSRSCQAAHLLGRVLEHRDDEEMQGAFRFSSAMQIHSTLESLTGTMAIGTRATPEQLSTAFGLLASARFTLYDPYSCTGSNHGRATVEEIQMQSISLDGLKNTASDVLQYLQHLHSYVKPDLTRASPLLCDSIYQAATTFLWLQQENGDPQATMGLITLTDILQEWSARWNLAWEYLKLLDVARQRMAET